MNIFSPDFNKRFQADLQRVMSDDSIPALPVMRDLLHRTEVVTNHVVAQAQATGPGTVINL